MIDFTNLEMLIEEANKNLDESELKETFGHLINYATEEDRQEWKETMADTYANMVTDTDLEMMIAYFKSTYKL